MRMLTRLQNAQASKQLCSVHFVRKHCHAVRCSVLGHLCTCKHDPKVVVPLRVQAKELLQASRDAGVN